MSDEAAILRWENEFLRELVLYFDAALDDAVDDLVENTPGLGFEKCSDDEFFDSIRHALTVDHAHLFRSIKEQGNG